MSRVQKRALSLPLLAVAAVTALAWGRGGQGNVNSPANRQKPGRPQPDRGYASSKKESGRHATAPWRISFSGWKAIFQRTYSGLNEDRLLAVAGGLVFFVLLAIFPAIGAFVSLYALVADPTTISENLSAIAGVMPADSFKLLSGEVGRIAAKSSGTLGLASVSGMVFALWSANAGTKALFDALNVAYEAKERRGFILLNLQSLAFTAGAIVFMLLAAAAVVIVPLVFAALGLQDLVAKVLSALRWPILFFVVALALAVLYRFAPSRHEPKWRWVTPGSLAASLLWLLGSGLFSFYLTHFANYNATYGSLGALIGLLMWLWLTFIVVLAGAELDAAIEYQAGGDSSVNPGKSGATGGAPRVDGVLEDRAG